MPDERLDALLAHYIVDVDDSTVDAICRSLATLPPQSRNSAAGRYRPESRRAPSLFWPGVGLAFGMLMLGILVGSDGMPSALLPGGPAPDFSDLVLPQAT